MYKILMTSVMLLISSTAYSEASIDPLHQDRTFLLTAPGTVTGGNQRAPGPLETNSTATTLPQTKPTKPRNTVRYRYVGESSKFRQFGQDLLSDLTHVHHEFPYHVLMHHHQQKPKA